MGCVGCVPSVSTTGFASWTSMPERILIGPGWADQGSVMLSSNITIACRSRCLLLSQHQTQDIFGIRYPLQAYKCLPVDTTSRPPFALRVVNSLQYLVSSVEVRHSEFVKVEVNSNKRGQAIRTRTKVTSSTPSTYSKNGTPSTLATLLSPERIRSRRIPGGPRHPQQCLEDPEAEPA
jgi:hypothetical protein